MVSPTKVLQGYYYEWHTIWRHYNDVIMGAMASLITSVSIVYSSVYSGADQIKHQSSASLAFVRGMHRWPVISPHKWPVTRKMFPFDDVIMGQYWDKFCMTRGITQGGVLSMLFYSAYGMDVHEYFDMNNDRLHVPDSKVHGANMGLIWGQQVPGGPHVGPTNFAISDIAKVGS